jgi:uncharacterized protein with HEPN domain
MQHDSRAYLWDAREAAGAILEFVAGKTFEDYASDRLLRSAVERQSEIIGEALNQLCKIEPQWAGRIPDVPQIIAFRNVLIHGYASVNDLTVWRWGISLYFWRDMRTGATPLVVLHRVTVFENSMKVTEDLTSRKNIILRLVMRENLKITANRQYTSYKKARF